MCNGLVQGGGGGGGKGGGAKGRSPTFCAGVLERERKREAVEMKKEELLRIWRGGRVAGDVWRNKRKEEDGERRGKVGEELDSGGEKGEAEERDGGRKKEEVVRI